MTAPLIDWRSRPPRTSRYHMALVEAAVAEYAEQLWQRIASQRLRWLRQVLRRIRPTLERLIALRTPSPEEVLLEQLIRQASLEFPPPDAEALAGELTELGRKIALQYGFLPNDPRTQTLEREFRELLEGDLLSYWRTLTDPKVLARRLAELRGENKTTAQIIRQVQQEYGAGYYSAERLVRTLYNSGANRAQLEALRAAGYTHKRWLTARDNRVRVAKKGSRFDHRRMDGMTVPLEEPFTTPAGSRLMYPGDRSLGAPAGEVVNCRCTVVGVVLEDALSASRNERGKPQPARGRLLQMQPGGTPISTAIYQEEDFPDKRRADLVRRALAAIDRVHGDGQLERIKLVLDRLSRQDVAAYRPSRREMVLDPSRRQEELDIIHETGHLLDHQTVGEFLELASVNEHPNLSEWKKAVEASRAVAGLKELLQQGSIVVRTRKGLRILNVNPAYVEYLLKPEELFARSYSQFVAVSSNDPVLLAQVGRQQNRKGNEIGYNILWDDEDFEPIAQAFESLFRRLGWLQPLS